MAAYVVRYAEGLEFVGIVSCDDPSSMFMMIDEFCDPSGCEYAELPHGMIGASGPAPAVLNSFREEGEAEEFLTVSGLCEEWAVALGGGNELIWEPVFPD